MPKESFSTNNVDYIFHHPPQVRPDTYIRTYIRTYVHKELSFSYNSCVFIAPWFENTGARLIKEMRVCAGILTHMCSAGTVV